MRLSSQSSVADSLSALVLDEGSDLTLRDGSRVAVVGGGPAGSFFSFFLLKMAEAIDLELEVDIYEPRSFSHCGPAGCNQGVEFPILCRCQEFLAVPRQAENEVAELRFRIGSLPDP